MSSENVEVVRESFEGLREGTPTKVVELHVVAFVDFRGSEAQCTFSGSLIRPAG